MFFTLTFDVESWLIMRNSIASILTHHGQIHHFKEIYEVVSGPEN